MNYFLVLKISFLLLIINDLYAQNSINNKQKIIEFGVKYGSIYKHTPKFLPEITEKSMIYELSFSKQRSGQRAWEAANNYPITGWSFLYADYGNKAIFGQAIGLMPTISFLTRLERWRLNFHYRVGVGAAYISRFYHPSDNPTNNVIGSHINNVTMFMLGIEWEMYSQFYLLANTSFTHFSNGTVNTPNLGINIPATGLTLKYFPQKNNRTFEPQKQDYSELFLAKKIAFNLKIGLGFHELDRPNGPLFNIYTFAPFLTKNISFASQIQLGLEVNYYESIYHFILNQVAFLDNQQRRAFKVAGFVGYEFLFGRITAPIQVGYYAYNPFFQDFDLYFKLGLQAYLYPTDTRFHKNLFVGIYLKSHFAQADYVELGLGWKF